MYMCHRSRLYMVYIDTVPCPYSCNSPFLHVHANTSAEPSLQLARNALCQICISVTSMAAAAEPAGVVGMDPALHKAATQGCVGSLRKLVVKDVKILNSKTPQNNTALHVAALYGHPNFTRELLMLSEELLIAKNADGDTPLHLAARNGKAKVADHMISRAQAWPDDLNADDTVLKSPLITTNRMGNTPLHEAVLHQNNAVALRLLDADHKRAHDLNNRNESPLDIAAREGLVQVVRKIVNVPWVPTDFIQSVGGTALHQAVLGGHTRKISSLLVFVNRVQECSANDNLQVSWRFCWRNTLSCWT